MAIKESIPRGVRPGDPTINEPFLKFFQMIQDKAASEGKVFFIDTGDGDVTKVGELECETLSGWMIDASSVNAFERQWAKGSEFIEDKFWDEYTWVKWKAGPEGVSTAFTAYLSRLRADFLLEES